MNPAAILPIISKGVSIAMSVWDNRDVAFKAIDAVKSLLDREGEVTQAEIDAVEADLDALLNEFNQPLPPAPVQTGT